MKQSEVSFREHNVCYRSICIVCKAVISLLGLLAGCGTTQCSGTQDKSDCPYASSELQKQDQKDLKNLTSCDVIRETFKKKKVQHFLFWEGGRVRTGLCYIFFFQKHGLKWLDIAL